AFRVAAADIDPRIVPELLQAQRDARALAIELEHLDLDFLAHADHFARILDALPGHVGNVQQAIDAAEIDERTVVHQILDDALEDNAFLQRIQQLLALFTVLFLEHVTARDDDVVAAAIKLDDAEFERLAFQVSGIAHRADVDQRAWQERADAAHVDGVATLDLAADLANDGFAVFIGFG